MKKSFACILILFPVWLSAQVVFSEIMFDVPGSDYNDEFVELYNLSSDSVSLDNWRFSDSTGTDGIVDAGMGLMLAPHQFAVLLDGSYFDHSVTYDEQIPDSALILKIDNNAFGASGLANSNGEPLLLINSAGDTIQHYRYSTDNPPGYSDEKIIAGNGNAASNWANSLVPGGTPGYRNSVTPFNHDLAVDASSLIYLPNLFPTTSDSIQLYFKLFNAGLDIYSDSVSILLYVDENNDSLYQSNEILIGKQDQTIHLLPGEYQEFKAGFNPAFAGIFPVVLKIEPKGDENNLNNTAYFRITIYEGRPTIAINEIKFLTTEEEPEWVEIFNYGDHPFNLMGFALTDTKDTARIDSFVWLQPGQYKVFAENETVSEFYEMNDSLVVSLRNWPRLNNSGDILYLLNPGGGWVEQVPYESDWLEGMESGAPSLERINPQLDSRKKWNWGPSTANKKATPAARNSIYAPVKLPDRIILSCSPNPFSPDADGRDDYVIISLKNPLSSGKLHLKIFDINGHCVRTLNEATFTGASFATVWDGRRDDGALAAMGIYIVLAQVLDDRNGVLQEKTTTVVLAKKM